jgi:NTP pyrophosphatase (non-canonical NTP hydrolase)
MAMTEEEHLLTCLMEEASEVAQACAKVLRFGLDDDHQSTNPDIVSPRFYLQKELNDLLAVCQLLSEAGVLPMIWINQQMLTAKKQKLAGMMEYSRKQGALEQPST